MKENVCMDCKYYEECGRPERFMKCSVRMLIPIIDRKLRERGL